MDDVLNLATGVDRFLVVGDCVFFSAGDVAEQGQLPSQLVNPALIQRLDAFHDPEGPGEANLRFRAFAALIVQLSESF